MNRRPKRETGFTLIELLIAVSVFAIMGVMAYGGLNAVLRTQAHLRDDAAHLRTLQLAMRFLERDVGQIAPRPLRDQYGDEQAAVRVEDPAFVEFTKGGWRNPGQVTRSRLQRVAYALEDDALIRYTWPVLDGAAADDAQAFSLVPGIEDWRIRVLDTEGTWHNAWPPVSALGTTSAEAPRAAAIEFTLNFSRWGEIRRHFALPG